MSKIQRPVKSASVLAGKLVKLREGNQIRDREWIFNRTDQNLIFLIHNSGAYGLVVEPEDIDWNEVQSEIFTAQERMFWSTRAFAQLSGRRR